MTSLAATWQRSLRHADAALGEGQVIAGWPARAGERAEDEQPYSGEQSDGQRHPQDAGKGATIAALDIEVDLGGAQPLDQLAGVLRRIADLVGGTVRGRDAHAVVARAEHHVPELALLQLAEKRREGRLGGPGVP